ncbi:MAG: response regulator [Micropepsaceae bacterium]
MIARTVETPNVFAFEPAKQAGCRILIVEDQMLIALSLADAVLALDATPVVASRVAKAVAFAVSEPFDAAIVDMNLAGEPADAVLDALSARDIPIVITTGYGVKAITEKYRGLPLLAKPYTAEQIEAALLNLLAPCKLARSA